jgi:hypothetical protein
MKRTIKQKRAKEPAELRLPKLIEGEIEKIMKEKTPMPDSFSSSWYRSRDLDMFFISEFNSRGTEFVSILVSVLKTNRHPMVRHSAAKALGEIGTKHPIYLQAEDSLYHASKHDPDPGVREVALEAGDKVNQKKLLDVIFGRYTPMKLSKTVKLTQELLDKATEIYCKHAWRRAPTDGELYDMRLETVLRQIETDGEFECRLGCQNIGAGNMKLFITRRAGAFYFWVYENDYGCGDKLHKANEATVRRIEEEWRQNGISVSPRADSRKS